MSNTKTFTININDIFDELKHENNRLKGQLLAAEEMSRLMVKMKDNLNDVFNCCKCGQNVINRCVFNQLLHEYQTLCDQFVSIVAIDGQSADRSSEDQSNGLAVSEEEDTNEDYLDINESIDDLNHTKSGCDSNFSVIERNTKCQTNVRRVVCNFNGCHFECMSTTKMQRHVRTRHMSKTTVSCDECLQMFWSKHLLSRHMKEVHKELYDIKTQKFICNYNGCGLQIKKLSQLLLHKRRHFGQKQYKCCEDFPECEWSFFTPGELRNHQISMHSANMPQFVCQWPGCGLGFVVKGDLDLHKLQKHSDCETNLEVIECPKDSFNHFIPNNTLIKSGFNSNYSVVRHRKTKKVNRYVCNYMNCDFKCLVIHKMEAHVKGVHFNRQPIVCHECEEEFWSPKQLTKHIRLKHCEIYDQNTRQFKCTYDGCNLWFDRYSKLSVHRRRHYGEKSFKCSDSYAGCKWTFFTLGELKNHHLWSHSDELAFECDYNGCNKRFKLRNLLADHKLIHTPDYSPFSCEWPGCDYRCARQSNMKVHITSHTGVKQFSCEWPECGQTFRTKSNLNIHYAIHTNKRNYSCDWPGCEYRCITSTSMRRHKDRHKPVGDYLCDWPECFKRFKAKIHTRAHKGDKPFNCLANDCVMKFTEKKQMIKHYRRRHSPK